MAPLVVHRRRERLRAAGELRQRARQGPVVRVERAVGRLLDFNGLTQPIITNRTVKNTVVAKDQQTIAVGDKISQREMAFTLGRSPPAERNLSSSTRMMTRTPSSGRAKPSR